MNHDEFLIWMLLFPIMHEMIDVLRLKYVLYKKYDEYLDCIESILYLCIYFGVGYKLY